MHTGDTPGDPDQPTAFMRMFFPEPVISMSIEPKTSDKRSSPSGSASSVRGPLVPLQLQRGDGRRSSGMGGCAWRSGTSSSAT